MKRLKLNLSQLRLLAIPLFLGAGIATAAAADELVYGSGTLNSTTISGWAYSSTNNLSWQIRDGGYFATAWTNSGAWAMTPPIPIEKDGKYYVKAEFCVETSYDIDPASSTDLVIVLLPSGTDILAVDINDISEDMKLYVGNPPESTDCVEYTTSKKDLVKDTTYHIGIYSNANENGAAVVMNSLNLYRVDAAAPIIYPTKIELNKTSVSLLNLLVELN